MRRPNRQTVLAASVAAGLIVLVLIVAAVVGSSGGQKRETRNGPVVERLDREERGAPSVTPTTTREVPPRPTSPTTQAPSPITGAPTQPTSAPTTSPRLPPGPSGGDLASLVVADPQPAGYDRDLFGSGWIDADRDCQDTRAEVLIEESRVPVVMSSTGCTVVSGEWVDPWSGVVNTSARSLDVDHTVPLANAWRSGAWAWEPAQRVAYANDMADPAHLIGIPLGDNRSKSDRGPEGWRPADRGTWCLYAQTWASIKARWRLSVSASEHAALVEMAATC